MKADNFHIHHQLLKKNFSVRKTVLIIYIVDVLFAATSILYVVGDRKLGYIIYGILFILVIIFVLTTNVVFDKTFRKKKIK